MNSKGEVAGHNEYQGMCHNGWQVKSMLTSALLEKTFCPKLVKKILLHMLSKCHLMRMKMQKTTMLMLNQKHRVGIDVYQSRIDKNY
uniref:Uncharacterized protein n=1 Tax=Romanomermis culicivorax TaxID=13658 RepID=A0A915KTI3_ROMCU